METLQRLRMSYDDYRALPDDVRAEWVDGEVVVSPSPTYPHQKLSRRLANAIESGLPGVDVVEAVTTRLPNNRERIPDIIVSAEPPDGVYIERPPLAVVEILSPSTRTEDLVRKSADYFAAGIRQYWVMDSEHRSLEVLEQGDDSWRLILRLDDANPRGGVEVAGRGTVALDLAALLDS